MTKQRWAQSSFHKTSALLTNIQHSTYLFQSYYKILLRSAKTLLVKFLLTTSTPDLIWYRKEDVNLMESLLLYRMLQNKLNNDAIKRNAK